MQLPVKLNCMCRSGMGSSRCKVVSAFLHVVCTLPALGWVLNNLVASCLWLSFFAACCYVWQTLEESSRRVVKRKVYLISGGFLVNELTHCREPVSTLCVSRSSINKVFSFSSCMNPSPCSSLARSAGSPPVQEKIDQEELQRPAASSSSFITNSAENLDLTEVMQLQKML